MFEIGVGYSSAPLVAGVQSERAAASTECHSIAALKEPSAVSVIQTFVSTLGTGHPVLDHWMAWCMQQLPDWPNDVRLQLVDEGAEPRCGTDSGGTAEADVCQIVLHRSEAGHYRIADNDALVELPVGMDDLFQAVVRGLADIPGGRGMTWDDERLQAGYWRGEVAWYHSQDPEQLAAVLAPRCTDVAGFLETLEREVARCGIEEEVDGSGIMLSEYARAYVHKHIVPAVLDYRTGAASLMDVHSRLQVDGFSSHGLKRLPREVVEMIIERMKPTEPELFTGLLRYLVELPERRPVQLWLAADLTTRELGRRLGYLLIGNKALDASELTALQCSPWLHELQMYLNEYGYSASQLRDLVTTLSEMDVHDPAMVTKAHGRLLNVALANHSGLQARYRDFLALSSTLERAWATLRWQDPNGDQLRHWLRSTELFTPEKLSFVARSATDEMLDKYGYVRTE